MNLALQDHPTDRLPADSAAPAAALPARGDMLAWVRRLLGVFLTLLALAPVHRLLSARETGLAGFATAMTGDIYFGFLWSGMLLVLPAALLAGWFLQPSTLEAATDRVRRVLLRPRIEWLALGAATLTFVLSSAFALLVLHGEPSMIDARVQLLHARYLAEGMLAGPASFMNEFWHIQNSLITERGWISQYPPGHVLLLATGFKLGVVWAVGPLLAGVTVFFTMLSAARLLPERPAAARLGGVLLAVSPFLVCLGGSFMNHVAAAALFALALYLAIRAREDGLRWAVAAGAALAYAFAVRPLSSLVVGGALCCAVWLPSLRVAGLRALAARLTAAAAGAAPLLLAFFAYNAWFFGGPFRLGYQIALGPAGGLGFHRDPWGNLYGPIEALGYTASDLLSLGVHLFETPLSAVLLVGLYLVAARRVPAGVRVFAAWALALVASNALYWHHGSHMGPRMLLEAAPAWVLLATVAGLELAGSIVPVRRLAGRFSTRSAVAGGIAFALLLGIFVLAPQRARSYGGDPSALPLLPRAAGPALVFVHDGWPARLSTRLAVAGFTLDAVETAARQNPPCLLETLADDLASGDAARLGRALAQLDMQPRAQAPMATAPRPAERMTAECLRQARSDAAGVLDIARLVWQGDLPGAAGTGTMFVRDLGPDRNAGLIAAMPERTPYLYHVPSPGAAPRISPYAQAITSLWGAPSGSP